jgi:hypothetical protein
MTLSCLPRDMRNYDQYFFFQKVNRCEERTTSKLITQVYTRDITIVCVLYGTYRFIYRFFKK